MACMQGSTRMTVHYMYAWLACCCFCLQLFGHLHEGDCLVAAMCEIAQQWVVKNSVGDTWVPETQVINDRVFAKFSMYDRKMAKFVLRGECVAFVKGKYDRTPSAKLGYFKKLKKLRTQASKRAVNRILREQLQDDNPMAGRRPRTIRNVRPADAALVPTVTIKIGETDVAAKFGLKGDLWMHMTPETIDLLMTGVAEHTEEDENDEDDDEDGDNVGNGGG